MRDLPPCGLWTLSTAASNDKSVGSAENEEDGEDEEDESANAKIRAGGFVLEYDQFRPFFGEVENEHDRRK
jgi:hypothetical protein